MSHTVQVKLSRFERTPWGFRLHGGTDFGTPLLIQKVNVSSLSETAGLKAGDVVLAVNGLDVQSCRHKEAQDTIVRAGNNFELTVQRGGVLNQALGPRESQTPVREQQVKTGLMCGGGPGVSTPPPKDWAKVLDANSAGVADNAEDFTRQFMSQLGGQTANNLPPQMLGKTPAMSPVPQMNGQHPVNPPNGVHHHGGPPNGVPQHGGQHPPNGVPHHGGIPQQNSLQNSRTATPTRQSGKQTPTPGQPKVVQQQYNTPLPLYSEDNIQEVLSQQAEVLSNGVKGINFTGDPESDLSNSETLKLVKELDNKGPEPEPGIDMDPSVAPSHYKGLANGGSAGQSYSFKMLQKALDGGDIGSSRENIYPSNGDNGLTLTNVHNVHAPKLSEKDLERSGSGPRMCASPSPSNSLPRRTESPVPSAPSPALGRSSGSPAPRSLKQTQIGQNQGRNSIASSEDIDFNSSKPKKGVFFYERRQNAEN